MCLGKGCENMKRRKAGNVPAFGSPGKMKKFRRIFSAFLLSLILLAAAEAPVLSKSESIAGQYEVSVTEMEKKNGQSLSCTAQHSSEKFWRHYTEPHMERLRRKAAGGRFIRNRLRYSG